MDGLNYNKDYREADKKGKVDLIYKVYWNPKKWVKPIEG
jgi:hypothetical protein